MPVPLTLAWEWVTRVWLEQARGVKLTLNEPVRKNYASNKQGYPQYLPRARNTNACLKRRDIRRSA
jgi:hypothetical protein